MKTWGLKDRPISQALKVYPHPSTLSSKSAGRLNLFALWFQMSVELLKSPKTIVARRRRAVQGSPTLCNNNGWQLMWLNSRYIVNMDIIVMDGRTVPKKSGEITTKAAWIRERCIACTSFNPCEGFSNLNSPGDTHAESGQGTGRLVYHGLMISEWDTVSIFRWVEIVYHQLVLHKMARLQVPKTRPA